VFLAAFALLHDIREMSEPTTPTPSQTQQSAQHAAGTCALLVSLGAIGMNLAARGRQTFSRSLTPISIL